MFNTEGVSVVMAWLLALAPTLPQPKARLNIIIIEGEGAINNIRQRTAREPIVEVEDENLRPVAGAAVVFLLPERGASGVFPNGSHMTTAITDRQGRAEARGLRPNEVAGEYQIRVSATYQGMTGSATITQTNVMGQLAGGPSGKTVGLLAAVSGAAAVGLVVALRARHAPIPATPPITFPTPIIITPGLPIVGPPR